MRFLIHRYNPEVDKKPRMQEYTADGFDSGAMLLDALFRIKETDDSLSFRRSCGEGVCGSDAMNINGKNGLACITPLESLKEPIEIRPVPGLPIIRDLVVDMRQFYHQYRSVKPWLTVHEPEPETEYLQTPEQRDQLDGLYECIYAVLAQLRVLHSGGTRINSVARLLYCKRGGFWQTVVTRPRQKDWKSSKDRIGCFAVTVL